MRRSDLVTFLGIAAVVVGLVVLAVPVIIENRTMADAANTINEIERVYDSMDDSAREECLAQAHAFNDRLRGEGDGREVWDYDNQLTYHDEPSTMMAWIELPKVAAALPVYHHVTDSVLMAGVGHIETTSLPVGGEGTLCVLSGHSGMPNARMFDDIHEMREGDVFVVWTLKDPYAYRVRDVRVVEPNDVTSLVPEPGHDLCRLVTCTPINVNSHRLVVTGERCEYVPDAPEMERTVTSVATRRSVPLMVSAVAVVLAIVVLVVRLVRRRRHAG